MKTDLVISDNHDMWAIWSNTAKGVDWLSEVDLIHRACEDGTVMVEPRSIDRITISAVLDGLTVSTVNGLLCTVVGGEVKICGERSADELLSKVEGSERLWCIESLGFKPLLYTDDPADGCVYIGEFSLLYLYPDDSIKVVPLVDLHDIEAEYANSVQQRQIDALCDHADYLLDCEKEA